MAITTDGCNLPDCGVHPHKHRTQCESHVWFQSYGSDRFNQGTQPSQEIAVTTKGGRLCMRQHAGIPSLFLRKYICVGFQLWIFFCPFGNGLLFAIRFYVHNSPKWKCWLVSWEVVNHVKVKLCDLNNRRNVWFQLLSQYPCPSKKTLPTFTNRLPLCTHVCNCLVI